MTERHTGAEDDGLDTDHGSHKGVPQGSVMYIVYIFGFAAVVCGLYFGMHYHPREVESLSVYPSRDGARGPVPAGVVPATAWGEIKAGNLGPNAGLQTRLDGAGAPPVTQTPVVPGDALQKRADLAAWSARRAYNGAPPTIPHRVDARDAASCVACHGPEGIRVGDVIARPMPHEHYSSCLQCHVRQVPVAEDEVRWLDNGWQGLPPPFAGKRAYPGAPPVIPHGTFMRVNCATCHGWSGADGLKSSHPWRKSCTQCHAPSAALDMQPGAGSEGPAFLPGPEVGGKGAPR